MFSGFDNFAEGFKRFSLDALQDQDDENTAKDEQQEQRLPAVPEQQHPTEHTESPTKTPPPQPAEVEDNEWDWDQDNAEATNAEREVVGGSHQKHGAHLQHSAQATTIALVGTSPAAVASPSELDQSTFNGQAGGVLVEAGESLRENTENTGTQAAEEDMEERGEGQMFGGEKNSGPSTLARDSSSAPLSFAEKGFSDNTVRGQLRTISHLVPGHQTASGVICTE